MAAAIDRRQAGALLLGSAAMPALQAAPQAVPWSRQASIYEVNLRQFTPEGTLRAFEAQLPRLQQLGVGIVWLMPVHPIGVLHRKGTLGSYYAVRDYTAVNPEFGTLADLQRVVRRAHALGLRVILDWVANHTAWDHAWISAHPDWYLRNDKGEIGPFRYVSAPGREPELWDDVVGLDYRNPALWPAMTDAMAFWLREAQVDGFRCDVAHLVPLAFWEQARAQLQRIRPVFMLAESDQPELHAQAFDMTYDWALYDTFKAIARGQAGVAQLRAWWLQRQARYPAHAIGMNFTGNHDSNSWNGSDAELYGSAACLQAMAVLAALLPGMPLVYGGQESFFEKRLQFFEKDPIDWSRYRLAAFYRRLLAIRRRHPALASGPQGGRLLIDDSGNEAVFAFSRRRGQRRVDAVVNLSASPQVAVIDGRRQTLLPWGWRIREA